MTSLEIAQQLVAPYCAAAQPFRAEPGASVSFDGSACAIVLLDSGNATATLALAPEQTVFVIISDHERSEFDALKDRLTHFASVGAAHAHERVWIGCSGPLPGYHCEQPPVIISYYTNGNAYELRAEELQQSIAALGDYPFYLMGLDDSGVWEVNCSIKSMFILNVLSELQRPVIWVDADAKVFREPLVDERFDFAVHRFDGWEFASGTIYFNTTDPALRLLRRWVELCLERPLVWDQILLDQAWCEVSAASDLLTGWLPESYTFIYDRSRAGLAGELPVVEHYQESRAVPSKRPKPVIPPEIPQDRRRARASTRQFPDVASTLTLTPRGAVRQWPGVQLDFEALLQIRQNICQQLERDFYFVQVGAMDGVRFDPIHAWVRDGNWQGLLIEPLPDIFEELQRNYGSREGLHFINAAIDREPGEREMYRIPKDRVEAQLIPEWALGISSFYNDRNALGGKQVDEATRVLIDELTVRQTVRCITFDQLLDDHAVAAIDLLQIDTEGHDWAVLESFPFERMKPALIGFEHYNLPDTEFRAALAHLEQHGYAYSMDHKDVTATLLRYPG